MLLTAGRRRAAVAALAVDQLVAWGVLYYAYTVLSVPIASELGVPRLHVAAMFSLCLLVAGWTGRRLGPVLDARGTRRPMRAGALVAPPVFATIALAGGLPAIGLAFAALGAVHALTLYDPAFRTVVDWHRDDRARARALLALTIVGGFASTVFLPLTSWLVEGHGWRAAVVVLACVLAAVLVPIRFALPLPDHGSGRVVTRRGAAPRSATLLALGLALHAFAATGFAVYLVWHLVEQGASLGRAAAVAGAAGAAQVPGRILWGVVRRGARGAQPLAVLLLVQAAAIVVVVLAGGWLGTAGVLLFGAASGVMTLERAAVVLEWYGRDRFGAHHGRLAAATGTARALAPFAVEAGHLVASYAVVFAVLGVALVAGAWTCRVAAARWAAGS